MESFMSPLNVAPDVLRWHKDFNNYKWENLLASSRRRDRRKGTINKTFHDLHIGIYRSMMIPCQNHFESTLQPSALGATT